jgi:hypothetical protein
MAAEHVLGLEAGERAWRCQAQQRMDAELFAAGAEVAERAERIADDEHAALGPPERDLPPEREADNASDLERAAGNTVERGHVERNAVARGELRAVSAVAVDELNDAGWRAEGPDPLVESLALDGVDEPDTPVVDERVRGAEEVARLGRDPADAGVELLVDETDPHGPQR